jgi:hypothetical protein
MTAAVPLDRQLTDTYFVVAHLHYVVLGINVFPVLGGIVYWFSKFTGRLMNEYFGKLTFWVVLTNSPHGDRAGGQLHQEHVGKSCRSSVGQGGA